MSGLRALYEALETQIHTILDSNGNAAYKHIHTYNNDVDDVLEGKEPLYHYPHCLMEIVIEEIKQLGNGNQEWNCKCHLHIIHQKFHAGSEMEQNFDVLDLADLTFINMQKFKITTTDIPTVITTEFIATEYKQDFHHKNVYHFIQTFEFLYINNLMDEPHHRYIKAPPITVVINPPPVPTIAGDAATTTGTSETYTTESGMTNYIWTATGATIISGGTSTDNTITVSWSTVGSKSIGVDYTDTHGHNAITPTTKTITVT